MVLLFMYGIVNAFFDSVFSHSVQLFFQPFAEDLFGYRRVIHIHLRKLPLFLGSLIHGHRLPTGLFR